MTLNDWKNTGQYFDYQGQSIFLKTEGTGEPLVLLHGFPTSSWDWEKIWEPLAAKYKLIAVDLLGFGFSDKPKAHTYTIYEQTDLVEVILTSFGINSYHLLVHDYSVSIGQELLARTYSKGYPFDIKSIALLNGGIFPEQHRPLLIQKLLKSPIGFLISKLNSAKLLKNSFNKIFGETKATDQEISDFWACIKHNNGNLIMHKLIHYLKDRNDNRDRWTRALIEFKNPKILINGPLDPISGRHSAIYFGQKVQNGKVVLLEGIGHYPQTEAPLQVISTYLAFRKTL